MGGFYKPWTLTSGFMLVVILTQTNWIAVRSAECSGKVYASLQVTGAYTQYNGSNYSVKVNEYATFTCSGSAEDDVELESTLVVKCSGSGEQKMKSSAGTGSVKAKWQSNDNCKFNSECSLECSASTDCDSTDTQLYYLNKVASYESVQVNCTLLSLPGCQMGALEDEEGTYYNFWQNFTLNSPWGDGKFKASSTCEGATNTANTSISSTWIVRLPTSECECSSTFTYREEDSKGDVCEKDVIEETMTLRNEDVCNRVPAGTIVFWVFFVLAIILSVAFFVLYTRKMNQKNKDKPSIRQVERMTAMDHLKLTALIEVANNPDVDGSSVIPNLARPKPDPIYDDVEAKY